MDYCGNSIFSTLKKSPFSFSLFRNRLWLLLDPKDLHNTSWIATLNVRFPWNRYSRNCLGNCDMPRHEYFIFQTYPAIFRCSGVPGIMAAFIAGFSAKGAPFFPRWRPCHLCVIIKIDDRDETIPKMWRKTLIRAAHYSGGAAGATSVTEFTPQFNFPLPHSVPPAPKRLWSLPALAHSSSKLLPRHF